MVFRATIIVALLSFWVLEFEKVFLNMTGLLGYLLKGGSLID